MKEFITHAHAMADIAGELLRGYFRTPVPVDIKPDASPVTLADQAVEAALRAYVRQHLPEHGIIGEEEEDWNTDAEWVWVFDPIDGTRSFIAGRPMFTTLIALCHQGTPVVGIIDQPIARERWVGAQGQATTFNGTPIKTRACPDIAQALLASTSPHYYSVQGEQSFHRVRSACRDTLYGGDAYLYGLLAAGYIDLVIEEGLKFHDVAALVPVIEGAGGCMVGWDGSSLHLHHYSQVIASGDKTLVAASINLLRPHQ